jgi:hypothetical protein
LGTKTGSAKWACRCGHVSYDDFTSSLKTVKALEYDLRHSTTLRRVTITTKRNSLLFEWVLALRNIIISPFVQHTSSDSSNAGSSSSGPLESSSVDSQGSTSGSNLQPSFDGSGSTSRTSRRKKRKDTIPRKPIEVNRRLFLHVCVDVGRHTFLEVVEIDAQEGSQPPINCDQQLFRRLKETREKRWRNFYGLFLKLQEIRFVEVSILPQLS